MTRYLANFNHFELESFLITIGYFAVLFVLLLVVYFVIVFGFLLVVSLIFLIGEFVFYFGEWNDVAGDIFTLVTCQGQPYVFVLRRNRLVDGRTVWFLVFPKILLHDFVGSACSCFLRL